MSIKCKFCGSASYGSGCSNSPHKNMNTLMMKSIVFIVVQCHMEVVVQTAPMGNMLMDQGRVNAAFVDHRATAQAAATVRIVHMRNDDSVSIH